MNLHRANLGVFVPGTFTIPQNPFFMTATKGMAGRGMGALTPINGFTIPQNPFTMTPGRGMAGLGGVGCGGNKDSCGCGCSGGMGDFSMSSING